MQTNNSVVSFILDGKEVCVDFSKESLRPTHTLLHYLRSLPNHKGTKEGCGEGDCGACTVVIAHLEGHKIIYKAIDSCLVFLPMVHGKQVITIENLETKSGNKTILHPIQQAIIEENGTQCGFCTPGIIMSLFAMFKNHTNPNEKVIKEALSGNLCRCTGYNSIIKAAQSIAQKTHTDTFSKNETKIVTLLTKINTHKETISIIQKELKYFKPFSLEKALELKNAYPDALIVSGATDCALRVTKKHEILPLIIDVADVDELLTYDDKKDGIHLGAALKLEDISQKIMDKLPALYNMLQVFGSKQIRQMATLGGNVGSASPIGDTLPLLFAYNAHIIVKSIKGERCIPVESFIEGYRKTQILANEIIYAILIPKPSKEYIIKSYKISKRKELDISTVSVAFRLKLDKNKNITDVLIAYGGMAAFTKRAVETEKFLLNKSWTEKIIEQAMPFVEKDFSPLSDARAGKEMRIIAAQNVLLKFFNDVK